MSEKSNNSNKVSPEQVAKLYDQEDSATISAKPSDKAHVDLSKASDPLDLQVPYRATTSTASPNWGIIAVLGLIALGIGLAVGHYLGGQQALTTPSTKKGDPAVSTLSNDTQTEAPANLPKPVLTVETVSPTDSVLTEALSADGTIRPITTASVNGKVSGVSLEAVYVDEGDTVTKGQVLAEFDTDAMRQQIIQAEADLTEARTNFNLAQKDAERILPLRDIGAISRQEADRYQASASQSQASVIAAQSRLDNAMLRLQNSKVTAPVNGIISEKNADIGSVPSGQVPLFTIIEDGHLEWQAQIDPNKLSDITVGTPVKVSLPNNQSVMGRVRRIAPTAEEGSRQITVHAALDRNPNARSGMYQRGEFILGGVSQSVIPVSAVVTQDGYDYVMRVVPIDSKNSNDTDATPLYRVHRVKVTLGERNNDQVALLEPLSGEGLIVRQGGSFLNDGDIVRIANTTNEPIQ